MKFQKASEEDFFIIQKFYWDVIEEIHRNNVNNENLGNVFRKYWVDRIQNV